MAVDLAELKAMIEAALPGAEVEVFDEDGGGQHLRAVVSATQFEGLSRIDQHRLVKAAVKERFDDGTIHALSVKTSVPAERPARRLRSPADKKLHFGSPHARSASLAFGAWSRCDPPGPIHASTISKPGRFAPRRPQHPDQRVERQGRWAELRVDGLQQTMVQGFIALMVAMCTGFIALAGLIVTRL